MLLLTRITGQQSPRHEDIPSPRDVEQGDDAPLVVQPCAINRIGRATDEAVLEERLYAALAERIEAGHINALHLFAEHCGVER